MIPRKWRLAILNWLGAGYMTIERDDDYTGLSDLDIGPSIDINGLSFNVMNAQGGVIVQIRKYDEKSTRSNYSTHVIPEGEDVAETIGKIVALELWKA
jgi:hypothetical protein